MKEVPIYVPKALTGLLKDEKDERDYIFSSDRTVLPSKANLLDFAREIENQTTLGSCVANATCSALELMGTREKININLSRLFVYYNVREPYPGLHNQDRGAYLRDGFKTCKNQGVCTEETWDYIESKVHTKPSSDAYREALQNKVIEYRRVEVYGNDIKKAIIDGFPVTIGIMLGRSFGYIRGTIESHNYQKIGPGNETWGGHAMLVVGYDDELNGGSFIIENSWSSSWGDRGFCAIKYSVLEADGLDAWVCSEFETGIGKVEPKPVEPEEPVEPKPVEPEPKPEPEEPVEPEESKYWKDTINFKEWTENVILRDGECQICSSKENLEAHHINHGSYFKKLRYNLDNGITLCEKCHYHFHNDFKPSYKHKCDAEDLEEYTKLANHFLNLKN